MAERLASGNVRYSVNLMVDGQRIHPVIGRDSDGVTRGQAERAIESLRTKAREGRLDLSSGRKLHRSFAEAGNDYIKRLEESGGKNLTAKRMHLKLHLKPHFGKLRLDRLSEFSVKRYRKKRGDPALQRRHPTASW